MTEDFTYRGVHVRDVWPSGAFWPDSQTRWESDRRIDGSQRWYATLPTGGRLNAFSRNEMIQAIDCAIAEMVV